MTLDSERQARLRDNSRAHQDLVATASTYLQQRRYRAAAYYAEMAAYHATWHHGGRFVSPDVERILTRIGQVAIRPGADTSSDVRPRTAARVLHVGTLISGIGGCSHLLWRWIRQDTSRKHTVALTRLNGPVPQLLQEAVRANGGSIHVFDEHVGDDVTRASKLRDLARTVDVVILHIETEDIIPMLAFSDPRQTPPVVLVNHADHAFWLGPSISDVVANLRESGERLCLERRKVARERLVILPTPLDPIERSLSKAEAKRRIGVDENAVVLMSIARAVKFKSIDGTTYADAHVPVLQQNPESVLCVVGPRDSEEWQRASAKVGGRIKVFGEREDAKLFLQAADIYVDAYPLVSVTSLLEAGLHGIPVVSRCPHADQSSVLCADAPGLAGTLVRSRDVEEHTAALSRLIRDEQARLSLGRETHAKILAIHGEEAWLAALERLYAHAGAVGRIQPETALPPVEASLSDLDGLVQTIFREPRGDGIDDTIFRRRGRLPAPVRWSVFMRRLLLRPYDVMPAWLYRGLTRAGVDRLAGRALTFVRQAWAGKRQAAAIKA